MSNLISVERVHVSLGMTHVLDGVSLGVSEGARIGVVGRNGGGKSTLLRVLGGDQAPDSGRVTTRGGLTVGRLPQGDPRDVSGTVRERVFGSRPEHLWASDPRIRGILDGLLGGQDAAGVGGMGAAVDRLSGGEGRRVALAQLLTADPDVMLLDEPTNHLDVEGVAWLAHHLAGRSRAGSALVVITHDRWFLDEVATQTWEVVDGAVGSFDGGYAAYVLAKAERARIAAVTAERRANLLRKELAWLRRGPPARTSKPCFRLDAAAALIADEPPARDDVALARFATTRLGKDVIDLLDATVRLGERTILDDVTWRLAPGDRVGIIGANGAGKSTLLRALAGELPLTAGRRKVGKTVALAHLTQDVSELDRLAGHRVVAAVEDVRSHIRLGDKEVSAAQLAQRLGFTGARQQTLVGGLSGGERRRLQLLRLLMREPNVLLLDEPTNDLDIETLTAVEDVLDGWVGTLIVVSHDRYLLERMCDRQVGLLGDGTVRDLPGGVEEFLALRQASVAVAASAASSGRASTSAASPGRASTATDGADAAGARQARKEMARIERRLDRLADQEERLHRAMAERATDHLAVADLDAQLRSLLAERQELEAAWLEAADAAG